MNVNLISRLQELSSILSNLYQRKNLNTTLHTENICGGMAQPIKNLVGLENISAKRKPRNNILFSQKKTSYFLKKCTTFNLINIDHTMDF